MSEDGLGGTRTPGVRRVVLSVLLTRHSVTSGASRAAWIQSVTLRPPGVGGASSDVTSVLIQRGKFGHRHRDGRTPMEDADSGQRAVRPRGQQVKPRADAAEGEAACPQPGRRGVQS